MDETRLWLMRHGPAVEPEEHDGPDATRPLTKDGVHRTALAARGLAALDVAPKIVLASPLLRAQQTASIVADAVGGEVRRSFALEPEADPRDLLRELRELHARDVLAVGHLPHLDLFIAAALEHRAGPLTRMKKAGCALLCWDALDEPARLIWLLEPKQLRMIAGA